MRITGSKVHRIWKCAASAVLPQHAMDVDRPEWEPMRKHGQGVHGFLEVVGKVGRGAALAAAPADVVPLLEALDLDNLPVGLATEVSFAWSWQTGAVRELGRNLPRRQDGGVDYDHPSIQPPVDWSCEVPLTIDVMGVAERVADSSARRDIVMRKGYVGDYKSGHTRYPAPDMFGQTLLAALCVARVYGCDDVVVELLHIHDNGGHHTVRRTVNEWDLQAFEAELQAAMRVTQPVVVGRYEDTSVDEIRAAVEAVRVHGVAALSPLAEVEIIPPTPVEGPWCDYCPAFRSCPAKLALVRAIPEELVRLGVRPGIEEDGLEGTPGALRDFLYRAATGDPPIPLTAREAAALDRAVALLEPPALVLAPGALTIRNAAAAWEAIERIEDVLARAKEEICSIAAFEQIPLSDGRVIGRFVTERRGLNGKVAAELLRERLGPAAANYIEESVTLDALRKAVAKHRRPGEKIETKAGDGVYDRALQEVERRGGLELKVTDAVRPHVPKKRPT